MIITKYLGKVTITVSQFVQCYAACLTLLRVSNFVLSFTYDVDLPYKKIMIVLK